MTAQQRQQRFTDLVDEHKKIVYKVSRAYCSDRADREDLVQEIVAQLWRSFPRFDERRPFSTWMYRVALNVAISFVRRERRRQERLIPEGEALLETLAVEAVPTPEVLVVRQFVESLDPLNKALAILYLEGRTHREIADVLGISETNVGTKIGRLKQSMKRTLASPQRAVGE